MAGSDPLGAGPAAELPAAPLPDRPQVLLIGGEGGYSGVPRYLELLCQAVAAAPAAGGIAPRLSLMSDENRGGYDFAARQGLAHHSLPGLKTALAPLGLLRALRGLGAEIDRQQPDLVWAHARMAVLLLRLLALWRQARGRPLPPIALSFHGLPFGPGHRRMLAGLSRRLEAWFLRKMPPHRLHFLSAAAAAEFTAAMGGPAALARHRLSVLENCSRLGPPPPQQPRPATPTLVMTGRRGRQKNLEAAAAILAALPEGYRLLVCGAGTEDPAFQARFRARAGAGADIRFYGPIRDVSELLNAADLFLLTSRYEGMPIAALEAFEAGLPLVVPQIPGLAEILAAHPRALAVEIADPRAAAAAITALAGRYRADPAGENAAIRAAWGAHFSFTAWAPRARALLAELLQP